MLLTLNVEKFVPLMTAGLVILLSNMIKKGGKQLKWPRVTRSIGKGVCIVGWLVVAYLTGFRNHKSPCYQAIVGTLLIVSTAMVMEEEKVTFEDSKKVETYIVSLLYVLGWFLLGRGVAMKSGRVGKGLALSATLMAVASGLFLMPVQRKAKVVDGPGVMLCTMVWVFLSAAFSTRN